MTELVEVIVKRPSEEYPYAIDYTNRLPEGTTVESCAVAAVSLFDNEAATSVLADDEAEVTDTSATAVLQAGTAGLDYRITFTATLSDDSVLIDTVIMQVRNAP